MLYFVPDTKKRPWPWFVCLNYETKNFMKNKENIGLIKEDLEN